MAENEKVKEITDRLEKGLGELFVSDKYKTWLNTMSKFHGYSVNNTLLIAMQKPEASLIAGFKTWQKEFGRYVKKGEKGIRILAPAPYSIKVKQKKTDEKDGKTSGGENDEPQPEETEIRIISFHPVTVFDISQTDGKPLPEIGVNELTGSACGYDDLMQAVKNVAPVPVEIGKTNGREKGYFSRGEKKIVVKYGMSESQTLKTAVHETAHAILHNEDSAGKDRRTKEVEAESVAFTVCSRFGIDTSDYSFGYIASWSSGKDMKELKASLETIRETSAYIIDGMEKELKEIKGRKENRHMTENEKMVIPNWERWAHPAVVNGFIDIAKRSAAPEKEPAVQTACRRCGR